MAKKKAKKDELIEIVDSAIDQRVMTRGNELGLNVKQVLFCTYYAQMEETFGNGARSYMESHGLTNFMAAAACATRLLKNAKVLTLINEMLEMRGLNDTFVDKQLEFLITQHADFKSKLGAIKEYNALKKRVESKTVNDLQVNVGVIIMPPRENTLATTTEAINSPSEN